MFKTSRKRLVCNTDLVGSSSLVFVSRVMKEMGPGGFFPPLFFSNENTLRHGLKKIISMKFEKIGLEEHYKHIDR